MVLAFVAVACGAAAFAIEAEDRRFLEERAPALLKLVQQAEEQEFEELLGEVEDRLPDLREEVEHAMEEGEAQWAKHLLAMTTNELAIEFLLWQRSEGHVDEGPAKEGLRALAAEQIRLRAAEERAELRHLEEEIEARREELEWLEKRPEEALEELMDEVLEDWESIEEAGEEDGEEGGVYVPAPPGVPSPQSELAGVTFDYEGDILPVLETHCFDCHDRASAKGDLDLESALGDRPLVRNLDLWRNVAERMRNGDMPPPEKPQPSEAQRRQVRAWLDEEVERFDYRSVRNPGYLPARRLTREEYNRTIRDLVGLDLRPADQFPIDFSGTSGFSNSANTLFLATAHLDRYFTAAEEVIDAVRRDEAAWQDLRGEGTPEEALRRFAHRAFRRPPDAQQWADVEQRYRRALAQGKGADEALVEAFKFVLISPHFLLRVEEAGASVGEDEAVAPHDLATRLSYFLWASTPDDALLQAAGRGALAIPEGRRAQVQRLLDDSRSRAVGKVFAAEWLGTDDVGPRIRKDPIDDPWCTETLMAAMREETARFVHSLIVDNAPVSRLLDARYTFLNEELARFYGIPGVAGEEMRRVELESNRRGGLFGQAAVLATTSFPDRTSPVVRGTWILTTLLGTPPPPPPPDVPEIEVDDDSQRRAVRTLRQRLERHRESKRCAGCHAQIDPLGFALENYGEFGRWRNGVDNRGALPSGARFRGPEGLKLALLDTRIDDLGTQVIRRMLAYALGRQLEYYDEAVVREIAASLKPAGYPMREMVVRVVESYPFLTKRIPKSLEQP